MNDVDLFKILRPHVLRVSGVPEVILAPQNHQSPKGEYASIQVRYNTSERGQANISSKDIPDDKIETDIRPQRVMTCVIEFYRGEARQYAANLQQMNRRSDVMWPLFVEGISIRNMGVVLDLTELQASNYEPRARIEMVLWMEGSSKVIDNKILGVNVVVSDEKGHILDIQTVPKEFADNVLTPLFVDNWANRIYSDCRLGK